ncbi:hypothetical protein [Halanaeroarchaeum sulfurireducens]|uniref:Nucleic acid-binding protein n=1 Tax=Halanaeroarchaeum sulfurireducens TaxID=1604004 RepID=A0A0F7P8B7_9EURY|nr:hypothetical protein [Halanaeroarchaeum sulfurireducens]AKH97401.1 hypothetical protein HLASF_0909 [Halanaeroarchaeum sulfurireducens]ALG81803.1 hypothetical protein HLASA_0906 [Halanaeroarchaeum sulfurireducens]
MIVVDTSAFVSLAVGDVLDIVLEEYSVHTTQHVHDELAETATSDDGHGDAADAVLDSVAAITVHESPDPSIETSRIDAGEASCIELANNEEASFLITDDLRALPELQALTDAQVAISPIVLRALVTRDVLSAAVARDRLDQIAQSRDWLGAPIYRRAQELFE